MQTASTKILSGRWLRIGQVLWGVGMLIAVGYALYILSAFGSYLHSGTVAVSGRWNADSTAIVLYPQEDAALPIQTGDLLLAINGVPLPRRLVYTARQLLPFYGDYQATITATIQTPDQPLREVTLKLDQYADPTVNWWAARGQPVSNLQIVILVGEIVWVGAYLSVALFVFLRSPYERTALLSSITLVILGLRLGIADSIRWLFPYEYPLTVLVQLATTLTILSLLLLPNGRFYPKWTSLFIVGYSLFLTFNRLTYLIEPINRNFILIDLLGLFAPLGVQWYRYRHYYNPQQRQQIKWIVLGAGLGLSLNYFNLVLVALGDNSSLLGGITALLGRIAVIPPTIAVVMAVLRYRLYDLEISLNRSLVYGGVTFILLTVLGATLFLFYTLLPRSDFTFMVIVVVAVLGGMIFQPLRRRLQHLIDRRFFRLRLDLDELSALQQARHRFITTGILSGKRLAQVTLQNVVGQGGMGTVYYGERGTQKVAVKVLTASMEQDPDARLRFEREITLMRGLAHLNLVHFLEDGEFEGQRYFVMEYIEGQSLEEYLATREMLPLQQALLILRDVANALDYLHTRGIIHRDIKPANIILQDMRAVLMDFGIAKNTAETNPITRDGIVGTLSYTAPEQIVSSVAVDQRADIYALAVVTYQMLTGRLPFEGSVGQLVFAHIQQPPPHPQDINPQLSDHTNDLILQALSKDPADRPDSAGAFVAALANG